MGRRSSQLTPARQKSVDPAQVVGHTLSKSLTHILEL